MTVEKRDIQELYHDFGLRGPAVLTESAYLIELNTKDDYQYLIRQLFRWHYKYAKTIREECLTKIASYPELFAKIEAHKDFIRFQKQLILHRANTQYNFVFKNIIEGISEYTFPLFKDYYQQVVEPEKMTITWSNIIEQWFQKVDSKTLYKRYMLKLSNRLVYQLVILKKLTSNL
ncbi:MAG: hypothetical protein MI866_01975 [Bacteroidales bacterium]|nr:hypothetical protein [Bacteroidales bacterium]